MICKPTPVTVAAAAVAAKKRGPPPRPPVAYRETHTMDTTKGQPDSKSSNNLKSPVKLSLQDAHVSEVAKIVKSSPQEVVTQAPDAPDPFPRKRKYNVLHRPKAKQ